jgi:hypothetical protein
MVDQFEAYRPMQFPGNEICPKLPEVVIDVHAALASLPKARPSGKVEINPMDVGQRPRRQRSLDRLLIVRPGYDPDFMPAANLEHPVPTYSRL